MPNFKILLNEVLHYQELEIEAESEEEAREKYMDKVDSGDVLVVNSNSELDSRMLE